MTETRTKAGIAGLLHPTALVLGVIALGGMAGGATAKEKSKALDQVTGSHITTPRGDATVLAPIEVNGAVGDGRSQPLDADEAARPAAAEVPEIAADTWLPEDKVGSK